MKITGQRHPYGQVESTRTDRADARGSDAPRKAGAAAPATEVRVSEAAHALRAARAPETPDVEKVERLRAQIAAGEFKVDADAIADAMIAEER